MCPSVRSVQKYNLLTSAIITLKTDHGRRRASLPETMAALASDGIEAFPALRPHQAPALHAFFVQLAAFATGDGMPSGDAQEWAEALRTLTAGWPNDEPWCLVAPPSTPAFLQPPVPGGDSAAYPTIIVTPDELDPLVTAKNHDLKSARMLTATAEDWLFALISLQTTEGVMGAGKYGVMRMNGGYGSRPFLSAMPAGARPGARFTRDLAVLRRSINAILTNAPGFATEDEKRLLWLEPWDGETSLQPGELHPLAIEVCRRVRLEAAADGNLRARGTGSKAARVAAKELRGVVGDPWAPVETDKDGTKVLSVTAAGFGWALMRDLMLGGDRGFQLPLLAKPAAEDGDAVEILAAALARGQGKTEGFHTRRVMVRGEVALSALTEAGEERRQLTEIAIAFSGAAMAAARQCLRPALFLLFQKGPERAQLDRSTTSAQIDPWLKRFDRLVDSAFFDALWPGLAGEEPRRKAERAWLVFLHNAAQRVFDHAADAAPSAEQRRILALQRARDFLRFALRKHVPLSAVDVTPETEHVG